MDFLYYLIPVAFLTIALYNNNKANKLHSRGYAAHTQDEIFEWCILAMIVSMTIISIYIGINR